MPEPDPIRRYLLNCRELAALCSQNGWIDDASIRFTVDQRDDRRALVSVTFTEILMEGAGCVAGRVSRFGQLRLEFDDNGQVRAGTVV